jgi:hypothetical protein
MARAPKRKIVGKFFSPNVRVKGKKVKATYKQEGKVFKTCSKVCYLYKEDTEEGR